MKRRYKLLYKICLSVMTIATPLLSSCRGDEAQDVNPSASALSITSSVACFEGETSTKASLEGTTFEYGDRIRIKIICPYVGTTEIGETTYGGSFDSFWLMKWNGGAWTPLEASDGCDINGDYKASGSPNLLSQYMTQQTPYVFTASTWSEEKCMIVNSNNSLVLQYAHVFHADQLHIEDYKASDLLWAQTIMQTGTNHVHLDFNHVMAALKITVDGETLSENAVLTIVGMPDIDQQEVIVGDMYAEKSKSNSSYGYKEKNKCTEADNGKVIGVGHNENGASKLVQFSEISNNATYRAFRNSTTSNEFRIIVPPVTLTNEAVIWLRDGENRLSVSLTQKSFEQGKMYNIKIKKP